MLSPNSPIAEIDNPDFYAITAHFGQWYTDPATHKPRRLVALDLLYGQVKQTYRRRKLARVERRMRWGDLAHRTDRLQALGFSGTLNTAFVERINPSLRSGQALTLRHALVALSRRSWATAQLTGELLAPLEGWRAYPQGAFGSYPFCRPHSSRRLQFDVPHARRGKQTPRRYAPRTPATPALHQAQRRCKCGRWSLGSSLVGGGVVSLPRGSVT